MVRHEHHREDTQGGGNGEGGQEHHGHTHGAVDPVLATTTRGIWALKWSFVILGVTAALQVVVSVFTGSVALIADTIHNFGDAITAVPLWIAFLLVRRQATKRFAYGFGRVEDLAGAIIVLAILASAVVIAYESVLRLFNPRDVQYVGIVAAAGLIGFVGNEAVAVLRIRVGKQINSAALVADGHHARADGLTSLAVLVSALAVWAGFPIVDPVVGLLIAVMILKLVWDSAHAVFTRMLDGVDPAVSDELAHSAGHVAGVVGVSSVRARWLGHRLYAEVDVAVGPQVTVSEAHALAVEVNHQLAHDFPYVANAVIHVDPIDQAGVEHHRSRSPHAHDGLPAHSH